MKYFFIFCSITCFIAILKLPIGYYTFLRLIVFTGALMAVYKFWEAKKILFLLIFIVIAVLFNPIIPIHLYSKSLWMPIDVVTGIMFLLAIFINKNNTEEKEIKEEFSAPSANKQRDRIV